MPCWFEVFDNEDVHMATRRSATSVGIVVASGVVVTLAAVASSKTGSLQATGVVAILSITWTIMLIVVATRLRRLRRIGWCLKLTREHAISYNYARRKTVIPWTTANRIEWTQQGLIIRGNPPFSIEIPVRFSEFQVLSHLVYDFAEELNIPIYVDGSPLSVLDVRRLYPFLEELEIVPSEGDPGGLTMH